ncbi:hypothetical protein N7499_011897 [Penicillium canescens]|nr:hypothetical protein N7499_011897 [Penicillium canescens]KAJ6181937.1 hypothetical protein N7485_000579 [Penicillium canescens]
MRQAQRNWLAHTTAELMPFGRHAYRHALKPPATPTLDHLWISDDLLAATFRRFANGQRRHGSCVPGPLEARRRLAKRRNTALAGLGGNSAEDISCLFGRYGREHMKWTDHPWQRAQLETQGLADHSLGPVTPFPFSDQNPVPEPSDFRVSNASSEPIKTDYKRNEQLLEEFLSGSDWGIDDARDFTRRLRIDLQREPRYSRQIFERLLARSDRNLTEAIAFLDDPFLNTRGSGNYVAAVEIFVRGQEKVAKRTAVLDAINRALELGLISTDEICKIITALPNIVIARKRTLASGNQKKLLKHYQAMWKAIGSCNILGYHDLDRNIVDVWLGELLSIRSFEFAEEVIIETHDAGSRSQWPSLLVQTWLEAMGEAELETNLPYPDKIFTQLDVNCAADCIIRVTESLLSSSANRLSRNRMIQRWKDCLSRITAVWTVAESQVWFDFPLPSVQASQDQAPLNLSTQRQIVLRLWLLRNISRSMGPMYSKVARTTDRPISSLLNLFELVAQSKNGSLFTDLMREIHALDLPCNSLLPLALNTKGKNAITKTTRDTLWRLETAQLSLAEIWTNPSIYKGVQRLFHGTFEDMFQRMNLTNPATVDEFLHLARTGNSQSIWSVLRIINNNTAFKLCLNKAWMPIPHPDEKVLVRYHPPQTEYPEPHAAVDLINKLAIAFSCCETLSPCQAYHMVHWLYNFLRRHSGPVDPMLCRALYHAGVTRYRRDGGYVSATRYEYILWIIRKFEGPEVAKQLSSFGAIRESMTFDDDYDC